MENKAFRLYPHGWTGNTLQDLNDLLSQGWVVKLVIPESRSGNKDGCNVLILERKITIK